MELLRKINNDDENGTNIYLLGTYSLLRNEQ